MVRSAILTAIVVLATACASTAPSGADPRRSASAEETRQQVLHQDFGARPVPVLHPGSRHLLCVMVDGLPVSLFARGLAAGAIPNLEALMAARPTVRTTALATFPSSTSPSVPEMLTGRYARQPRPTQPAAVHAFDRAERTMVRYLTRPDVWEWPVPDLFDAAEAAGLRTLTVFEGRWSGTESILTRGANLRAAALETLGIASYNGDRAPIAKLERALDAGERPDVVFLVFNDVDTAGHFHGPDSPQALHALEAVDHLLGTLLDRLRAARGADGRSLLDDTTIVLFGDHGMVPSGTFLDLQPVFERHGLDTYDTSTLTQVFFRERLGRAWTHWPDVLLVAGGSNVTQVYLRRASGGWEDDQTGPRSKVERVWQRPSDRELAQDLAELDGVAQVLRHVTDPGRVELRASGGRLAWVFTVHDQGVGRYAYVVPDDATRDPLDYLADPASAPLVCRDSRLESRCFMTQEEWQRATATVRYPGAVPLLPKAVRPGRFNGDLVVTARRGYTFLRGQHGDHGNLDREAMLTPFVLNGPGVVPDRHPTVVRLVDLYPTAAVLLGAAADDPALAHLDGRPLPCVEPPAPGRAHRGRLAAMGND